MGKALIGTVFAFVRSGQALVVLDLNITEMLRNRSRQIKSNVSKTPAGLSARARLGSVRERAAKRGRRARIEC
jgi:hypothetical protein